MLDKVAIVVLNWNGWQDTVECLESLFQVKYDNFQVIVVDTGSTDGSIAKIKEWAKGNIDVKSKYVKFDPKNKPISCQEVASSTLKEKGKAKKDNATLVLIRSEENLGFARGNNIGIRYALEELDVEYIMLLNNDIAVKADFLEKLVRRFNIDPEAAMVAPMAADYETGWLRNYPAIKRYNFLAYLTGLTPLNRILWKYSVFMIRLLRRFNAPTKVYLVGGFCMLFKKKVLVEIGLYDEATFLGWEEFIIAEKLLKLGYSTYFIPDSIVYHKIGQSTKKMPSVEKAVAFLESEKYFQDNYFKMPRLQMFFIRLVRFFFYSIQSLFNRPYRKNFMRVSRAIFGAKG
ncbi:glycosyltransferase family 2 protein [Candidatus Margulisiibacteriota bacterium]